MLTVVMIFSLGGCFGRTVTTRPYTTIDPPPGTTAAVKETTAAEKDTEAEAPEQNEEQNRDAYRNYELTGLHVLESGFTDRKITDEESAREAVSSCSEQIGFTNALDELRPVISSSRAGMHIYRLQQCYQGIPVYGKYVLVAASDAGEAYGLSTDAEDIPEDLELTANVTYEEVQSSIQAYAAENWSEGADDIEVEALSDDQLVIYDLDVFAGARLAYCLNADNGSSWEVIVDARSGEVLDSQKKASSGTAELSDDISCDVRQAPAEEIPADTKTGLGFQADDKVYWLEDRERGFYIVNYRLGNSKTKEGAENSKRLTSSDLIYGNDDEEKQLEPEKAFVLMQNVGKIRDYFLENFHADTPKGSILLGYNDSWSYGGNAYASVEKDCCFLVIEHQKTGWEMGDLTHEYTHLIQGINNASYGSGLEAKAIREGLSDTFACFYLDDWNTPIFGRSASDPASMGNPANLNDAWGKEDYVNAAAGKINDFANGKDSDYADWYCHEYATIISHAAYLMDQSGAFNKQKLHRLWYDTMITLPYNCQYINLRSRMEQWASNSRLYTEAQRKAVAEAFDAVGITYDMDAKFGNDITVTAYDEMESVYADYTIKYVGIRKMGPFGLVPHAESETIKADPSGTTKIHLEDGSYSVRISDNGYPAKSLTYTIQVKSSYDGDHLDAYHFGPDYVVAPKADLTILDKDGKTLSDCRVKAYIDRNSYRELTDGTFDLPEHSYYRIRIAHFENGKECYEDVYVQVKDGAADSLSYQSRFSSGKKPQEEPGTTEAETTESETTEPETTEPETTGKSGKSTEDAKALLRGVWYASGEDWCYLLSFDQGKAVRYDLDYSVPDNFGEDPAKLIYLQNGVICDYRIEPSDDGQEGVWKVIVSDGNGTEFRLDEENADRMECSFRNTKGDFMRDESGDLWRIPDFTEADIRQKTDQEESSKAEESLPDEAAASVYAGVVRHYEDVYGTLEIRDSGTANLLEYVGVFTAELIDFDQDGTDELLIGYSKSTTDPQPMVYPALDVWGQKDGKAVMLYQGAQVAHNDISSHCEYTFYEGRYYLVNGYSGYGADLYFMELRDGTFRSAVHFYSEDDQSWTVNDKPYADAWEYRNRMEEAAVKRNGYLSAGDTAEIKEFISGLENGYRSIGLEPDRSGYEDFGY